MTTLLQHIQVIIPPFFIGHPLQVIFIRHKSRVATSIRDM